MDENNVIIENEVEYPQESVDFVAQNKNRLKTLSLKLGLGVIVMFIMRILAQVINNQLYKSVYSEMSIEGAYALSAFISLIFIYLIPIGFVYFILKNEQTTSEIGCFKGTKYFSRSMSTFPALYGIPFTLNILMMIIIHIFIGDNDMMDSFNTVNDLTPASFNASLILFVELVVIAPIFEEIWFRGIILRKLYPYGSGFAIFTSGILFGLAHGNFQQFFYTTALGICLGYIAYATKSIVAPIIIHALFNSISGGLILFASTETVGDFMNNLGVVSPEKPLEVIYIFYIIGILLLAIIGVGMMVAKLTKANRYRTPTIFKEISLLKKFGILFSRVTVILGITLAVDVFTKNYLLKGILKIITN